MKLLRQWCACYVCTRARLRSDCIKSTPSFRFDRNEFIVKWFCLYRDLYPHILKNRRIYTRQFIPSLYTTTITVPLKIFFSPKMFLVSFHSPQPTTVHVLLTSLFHLHLILNWIHTPLISLNLGFVFITLEFRLHK